VKLRSLLVCAVGIVACLPAIANISFNITYTGNVTGLTNYTNGNIPNAVTYVENEYSALFTDPISVNITIDAGTTGLGGSNTFLVGTTYATIVSALTADKSTADDNSFVASLPVSDPIAGTHAWVLTCAQARALGQTCNLTSDGTFTFNHNLAYTYDPANRAVAGDYDFIGVAEHEFSEIMGRIFGLDSNFGAGGFAHSYMLNDLTRFTAPGVRSFANCQTSVVSATINNSPDNGTTSLNVNNDNSGGDCDDLNGSVATDPYNAFTGTNQAHSLNSGDMRWMDIIGYNLASVSTPEPATFGLVGGVLAAAGLIRRKLRARK
jgi:hypothetical protein